MFKWPKLFDVLVCAGCVAMLGYFHWHWSEGPRGVENFARLEVKLAGREDGLAKVSARREAIEDRVKLMRPESVDPDLAEQLVRDMLGYEKSNSIVVNVAQ